MTDSQINPYESPREPGTDQARAPGELPFVRRHPFLSAIGWLLAIVGTAATGFFVYLTVALFNLYRFQTWMGVSAVLGFLLAFGMVFGLMLFCLFRATPKANSWANVLPALLWTVALFIAGEVTFFTVCTMMV